ncbi:MAG: hopanoid-associated sugar epimerase [Elusimicrobiota bacterium]|jgi:dihydroflavonol-4-reductase
MPRALVTGGSGFIGSHVVRHLLAQKATVRCLIRPNSTRKNLDGLSVEYVIGDLRDPGSLKLAVRDCDWLFHVAADYRLWVRHPEEMDRVNIQGTRDLFEAAAEAKIQRIVFTSSVSAIGRPLVDGHLGIGREELEPAPDQLVGPYKKSKFLSDQLARDFVSKGWPIVIVNPSTPIGSRDIKPTPTGKMIVDFLNRKMPGYVETGLNFVDVENVAAGHWLAAQKGRIGDRYILGNRNMTLKAFLDMLAKIAGLPAPRFRIPYAVAWMAGAVSTGLSYLTNQEPAIPLNGVRMAHERMYYDASKAVRELGLPQTPIEEALQKAVSWFRQNGYVKP